MLMHRGGYPLSLRPRCAAAPSLDPKQPFPKGSPAPPLRRELVSQILPTELRNDEGAVLVVGGRGPDVVLEHQIALGGCQLGGVGFHAKPTRYAPISRGDSLGTLFGQLPAIARRTSAANIFSFRLLIFLTSSEAPTPPGPAL